MAGRDPPRVRQLRGRRAGEKARREYRRDKLHLSTSVETICLSFGPPHRAVPICQTLRTRRRDGIYKFPVFKSEPTTPTTGRAAAND